MIVTGRFYERSGTPFNDLRVPTDIVFLVVLWRLRYPLSLRHLAGMFLERGFTFSHETVRARDAMVAPSLAEWSDALPLCTERHAPTPCALRSTRRISGVARVRVSVAVPELHKDAEE